MFYSHSMARIVELFHRSSGHEWVNPLLPGDCLQLGYLYLQFFSKITCERCCLVPDQHFSFKYFQEMLGLKSIREIVWVLRA